tara:strand:- start:507 stop:1241 length:735 start_codon:yes stop_codon:yes gene_type:complete
MNNITLSKLKTKVNLNRLRLNNSKKIGEGSFGSIFNLSNNKKTNKRYVVKKIKKDLNLKILSFLGTGKFQKELLEHEIEALNELSKLDISPKVYYYDNKEMIYIIDKLDYNLSEMITKNILTHNHISKLIDVLKKLQRTKFKHNDLHSGNIMFSKNKNRFFIIDLGIFTIVNKCNNGVNKKICFNYEINNAKLLSDLFFYIKKNINSKKNTSNTKKQYSKKFDDLIKLFNIKEPNFKKDFLNSN